MKQKPITLRKFIETFPLKSFQEVVVRNLPLNFNELSYREKYAYNLQGNVIFKVSVSNNAIYVTTNIVRVHRVGCRIFKKSEKPHSSIYIEPNKITIKGNNEAIDLFLKHLGINWFKDIPNCVRNMYFSKSAILRAILTKRIYNEETLYKRIGTSCFQLKNVSWRAIKTYCTSDFGISIFDLRDFTRNVEQSINILSNSSNSHYNLYRDLLNYAAELQQIVDFTWSEKRIENEHRKQIITVKNGELSKKDNTPIYEHIIGNDNIKLLNTEKDIFLEGDIMCHCLYRCYYNKIKRKEYIAFHMNYPEDCTFSVRLGQDDKVILDQIYLKHDFHVKDSTREVAQKFIDSNYDDILEMFEESKFNKVTTLLERQLDLFTEQFDIFNEDIPF